SDRDWSSDVCSSDLFLDIITDALSHGRFVRMAAERGIPVICQKPMAPSLAEAEEMVRLCRENGVPFYIHENWRWQKQIREFKKRSEERRVGKECRYR